jgi:hypothetical protein
MTHIQNIPHVLEYGITHRNSPNANPKYISIGDDSLIETRDKKKVWVNNGENFSFEHKQIMLGDFIPFYFGPRMPMLYVIQKGFLGVKRQHPENIVYCVCRLKSIIDDELDFYFTDGHAIDSFSSCYNSTMIENIDTIVDFKAVKAKDWTVARDIKRKMEAEFLIRENISKECITGFIGYNESAKKGLSKMDIEENKIHVNGNYYF